MTSFRRDFLKMGATGLAAAGLAGGAQVLTASQAAAQAASDSLLRMVLNRGHVIVGTGSTNAPWHFEDESGELVGMDVTMGRILAKGLFDDAEAVEFVLQDPAQRIPNVATGKVDIVIQFMTMSGQRAQLVNFTRPYYVEGVALLTRPDADAKTFADLEGLGADARVSILQNIGAEDSVHQALPDATVMQLDTQANVLQALELEPGQRCGGRLVDGALAGFAQSRPVLRRGQAVVLDALRRGAAAGRPRLAALRQHGLHHRHVRPRDRALRPGLLRVFRAGAAEPHPGLPGDLSRFGRAEEAARRNRRWVTSSTST